MRARSAQGEPREPPRGLQGAREGIDAAADTAANGSERADYDHGDQRQNQTVLGHSLAVLSATVRSKPGYYCLYCFLSHDAFPLPYSVV